MSDEDDEMLRDSVRKFVDKEMSPELMRKWARNATFPEHIFVKWAELGWLALGQPEEYGGIPAEPRQMIVLAEELARNGFDITGAYATSLFLGMTVGRHGTPEQRSAVLSPLIQGKAHISTAISEPDTGSDISGVKCKAVRRDDGWLIKGEKVYCSGAHLPNTTILVTCRTDSLSENPRKGLTILLVKNDTPGLSISRIDTMGRKIFGTNRLFFDDVFVPDTAVLGEVGEAWKILSGGLDMERLFMSGGLVGNAQSAVDLAVEYAKQRVQFGKPIGRFQAISHALVDMKIQVDAARQMVYHATALLQEGRPCRMEASMAKLMASEALVEVTNKGMQVLGGYGYTTEVDMERWFRDGRVTTLMGGSSEIQRNIIAHEMGL
ncbi:acyl-CoA dehydrogenase family protein [Paraburkholderia sediminicola]|uniref:acyl-CoA dehydrogenase family protein n=1 Tax=Paraburkholderia sediminicola TaxID=458836 RepID=UPI0038B75874